MSQCTRTNNCFKKREGKKNSFAFTNNVRKAEYTHTKMDDGRLPYAIYNN
jgi:hypothetical protein